VEFVRPDFVTAETMTLEAFWYSLVVLRDDAVFCTAFCGKGFRARVLSDDAALQDVVLVARPVDEDVRVEGALAP